jgi:hypothetical protein
VRGIALSTGQYLDRKRRDTRTQGDKGNGNVTVAQGHRASVSARGARGAMAEMMAMARVTGR